MEILKDLRPLLDLGVTAILIVGGLVLAYRPPQWIRTAVSSHHQLAQGVRTLSESVAGMPKREEVQELLIGQEALRRETVAVRDELREFKGEIADAVQTEFRELRREMADGRRG